MRRILLLPLAVAVLGAVVAFAGVARPESARGDSTQTDLVTTNGHGVVTAVPDQATVSAGVRTDGATAAGALAANATKMTAVIAALKAAGGEEIQTQEVSLYPTTDQQGKVTGYTAQNTVSAKAKIAGAGALIDAAVGAGANNVDGPSLTLSDQDALTGTRSRRPSRMRARRHSHSRMREGSASAPSRPSSSRAPPGRFSSARWRLLRRMRRRPSSRARPT